MSTWDAENFYYSGQGVVLIGERDTAGKPKGLLAVGNVSDLKLSLSVTNLEHKESQSGQRATDLRLVTENKCALSMVMENFVAENLRTALRGSKTVKVADTVVAEATKWYPGKVMPLANAKISSLVVERGATALTLYTNAQTAWDYKVNLDSGSIEFNDGNGGQLVDKITTGGTVPTAITVGATTDITTAHTATIGDKVVFTGFAGADAALINGKTFTIVNTSAGHVFIDLDSTGKTITIGVPLSCFEGQALSADYDYADQYLVDAMTEGAQEMYMRFEGLNTADSNNPVVVEVFKFSVDPLKELSLIGDGIGQFTLEGSVLADPLQPTGSQFFKQTLLR